MSDPTAPRADASGVAPIVTHRLTPPGVLPRRGQVWLMVGVAGGILAIILFTGNHDPAPPRAAAAPNVGSARPKPRAAPHVSATARGGRHAAASAAHVVAGSAADAAAADDRGVRDQGVTRAQDPIAEERRRREYESLFANNVVQSPTLATTEPTRSASPRRSTPGMSGELGAAPPSLDDVAEAVVRASTARTSTTASLDRQSRRRPPRLAAAVRCARVHARPTVRCIAFSRAPSSTRFSPIDWMARPRRR